MRINTVKQQFYLWGFVLVLVPSLLIMALYTAGQVEIAKQKSFELMHHTMMFQKRLIDHWLAERAANVQEIAAEPFSRTLDFERMESALQRKLRADASFDSLSFLDKNGQFVISTLSSGIKFPSAADRPYFLTAQGGSNYISDVVVGRNSGKPIINFSSPVYDSQGTFQGVILGSVHTATLDRLISEQFIGNSGEILLVNREGTMITEPRRFADMIARGIVQEPARMKFKMTGDVVRKIRLGESGTAEWVDYLGHRVIGAYYDVPERGWTIISKIHEGEVLAPIYRQLQQMAAITFVVMLLILPLAHLLTKRIKRPIDWLVEQAELIAGEKYQLVATARPAGGMPRELAVLCDTFVNMSALLANNITIQKEHEVQLTNKVAEIQELNANLERNVQQRTQELQEMNAALEEEIAERKTAQDELWRKNEVVQKLAYTDVLTGLINRAGLNVRLLAELEQVHRSDAFGAVIFIDLDDLKMVNDAFGHGYGDELIKKTGERLLQLAGPNAVVGRIGGDEFMLIFPAVNQEEILGIAERIIKGLNQDFAVQDIRLRTSASAGITLYPQDGDIAEDILKNADNAMYAAKKAGKNSWRFFHAAMQTDAYEKVLLIDQLRHAADHGEFSLHYQPQICAKDRSLVGLEALLRWHHPLHGEISPERFIPLAEQSGLILVIGKWVLQEACRFGSRLTAAGRPDIGIAVNISPHQLCRDGFVDCVKQALASSGFAASRLELEITENALIASLEESTRKLEELRALDVGLALDDFGTGYSSLTYLQALPVNTLKIDKTFIDKLLTNAGQKSIVKTIVDLAHSLNMTVIAEGVETDSQLEFLASCNCDRIQGYIYSRPLPEAEVMDLLAR